MANVLCKGCNNRKKEEHFSAQSLLRDAPICSSCDIKALLRRVENVKKEVLTMRKEQEVVKAVTDVVEVSPKTKKQPSNLFLKQILQGAS